MTTSAEEFLGSPPPPANGYYVITGLSATSEIRDVCDQRKRLVDCLVRQAIAELPAAPGVTMRERAGHCIACSACAVAVMDRASALFREKATPEMHKVMYEAVVPQQR